MKLSIKNFLAVMTLMAIVGGDAAYGMKRKDQPEGLEQQDQDKKKKNEKELNKEDGIEENKVDIKKAIIDHEYMIEVLDQKKIKPFYGSYKLSGFFDDTTIKKNCTPVDEYNPLNCPGIPEEYFPFVRKAFQAVDILKDLIITGKIESSIKVLTLQDIGPENTPAIPFKHWSLIREAYDKKREKMEKPREVSVIAERLGMNCNDFIKILKDCMKNYNKRGYSETGIPAQLLLEEGITIDKIKHDTLLSHPNDWTSFEYYAKIRKIYDKKQAEKKDHRKNFVETDDLPIMLAFTKDGLELYNSIKAEESAKIDEEIKKMEQEIEKQEQEKKNKNSCIVQ
jgi:hypothetical protein